MSIGRPLLFFAGTLLAMRASSQDANIPDGPFSSIVARNMFCLVPIPPAAPPVSDPVDPPPKITPTGIMTIFGRDQALFKASNMARPGQPSKEEAYVLSEGERQDDIEVVKIDHVDGVITFNNHGTVQELPLVPAKDSGGSVGGGLAAPNGFPRMPVANIPRPRPMFGTAMRGDQPAGGGINSNLGQVSGGANLSGNFGHINVLGGGGPQPTINQQSSTQNNIEDQVMSAAKDMAQIELNRIATQDLVDQGKMPPLPPTMMTPQEATGIGGAPLINANEEPSQPVGK
jgi:hypothetical protein